MHNGETHLESAPPPSGKALQTFAKLGLVADQVNICLLRIHPFQASCRLVDPGEDAVPA